MSALSRLLQLAVKQNPRPIPKSPKRILLFRIGAIGDVLMTTPLVRAMRKKYPKAEIDYLTGKWSRPAVRNNAHIDEILTFEDSIFFQKKVPQLLSLARKIRKREYDLVIVLDISYLVGMYARLFGAPTLGYDRYGKEGWMHSQAVTYGDEKHDIEYCLDLGKALGINTKDTKLDFPVSKEDEASAKNLWTLGRKKTIGLIAGGGNNPGQKVALKNWPHFPELAKRLLKKGYGVVLLGGPSDAHLVEQFPTEVVSYIGKTSLIHSAALMKKCDLIVTNDTGPMHIASAVARKVLAIFGPTNPLKLKPLGKNRMTLHKFDTECPPINTFGRPPCYLNGKFPDCPTHACMRDLSVDEVISSAEKLLNTS